MVQLASPCEQVLVPRATKRPAPGTTPPSQNARATVDRTSGWRLESRANRNHIYCHAGCPSTRGREDPSRCLEVSPEGIHATRGALRPRVRTERRLRVSGAWRAHASMPASMMTSQLEVREWKREEKDALQTAGTLRTCKPRQRSTSYSYTYAYIAISRSSIIGELASIWRYALEGKLL